MGHHLFIYNGRTLPMRDWDVALTRHFLMEGARRLGDDAAASAIVRWDYQGPGVWIGIELARIAGCRAVFAAAIEAVRNLGEHASPDYLNQNAGLGGGVWLKEQPTSEVAVTIQKLETFMYGST
jgi:hypothetical protein